MITFAPTNQGLLDGVYSSMLANMQQKRQTSLGQRAQQTACPPARRITVSCELAQSKHNTLECLA